MTFGGVGWDRSFTDAPILQGCETERAHYATKKSFPMVSLTALDDEITPSYNVRLTLVLFALASLRVGLQTCHTS